MSEIEPRTPGAELERAAQEGTASALVDWAHAAQQAHSIAKSLARTSFVPQSLRGRPEDITAAILAGQELGLQPMTALRSMDIIQGTPALRAHALRAIVQSRGHEVKLVESGDERCVMAGRRRGEEWQEVVWDLERAQRLGLTGKDQWKKQPRAMLVARATGEICRLVASDAIHAMPYASEELDAQGGPDGGAQVPRVTLREVAPDADPDAAGEPGGGAPRAELDPDDPWYVPKPGAEPDQDTEDEATVLEFEEVEQ